MNRRDTIKSLLAGLFVGWLPKPKVSNFIAPDKKLVEQIEKMYIGSNEFYIEYTVWCVAEVPTPNVLIHGSLPAIGIKNHW